MRWVSGPPRSSAAGLPAVRSDARPDELDARDGAHRSMIVMLRRRRLSGCIRVAWLRLSGIGRRDQSREGEGMGIVVDVSVNLRGHTDVRLYDLLPDARARGSKSWAPDALIREMDKA